jgi:cytochrome oxidase Cu insertion factor (SCO1/SenC/PrrC family)
MLAKVSVALLAASASGLSLGRPAVASRGRTSSVSMATLYDFEANKIDGTPMKFDALKGKPALIMNVATL